MEKKNFVKHTKFFLGNRVYKTCLSSDRQYCDSIDQEAPWHLHNWLPKQKRN